MNKLKIFKNEKIRNIFLFGGLISFGVFFLIFITTCISIGYSAKEHCTTAQSKYEGDCVEALIQVLKDGANPYRLRNSAIWSLGQFGNSKALPILEKFYTGNIPNKEPYDAGISQYELKKAINLLKSGFNISSYIWRNKFILK